MIKQCACKILKIKKQKQKHCASNFNIGIRAQHSSQLMLQKNAAEVMTRSNSELNGQLENLISFKQKSNLKCILRYVAKKKEMHIEIHESYHEPQEVLEGSFKEKLDLFIIIVQ